MANGVTNFSSKIKCTESNGRYAETNYGPMDFIQVLSQATSVGLAVFNTQVGNKIPFASGDGSSTSNIGGVCPASGDNIDFLMRVPSNFDSAQASYVDIYYHLTGAATLGDVVGFAVSYNSASVNATTTALATAATTTGITDEAQRTLATGKSNGYLYKATSTIAASTLTEDTLPQVRIQTLGTFTAPELRISKVVHRYARAFL